MSDSIENAVSIKAEFTKAVRARVALGEHKTWGSDDSVAVIAAVVDAAYACDEDFDAAKSWVEQVVNPSAFAQKLEKLETSHPSHIRRPAKGQRSASVSDAF